MKAQTIISIVFATLLGGYLLFAMVFFPAQASYPVCSEICITLDARAERSFVSERELREYIATTCGELVGDSISYKQLALLEETLKKHPMLRQANAWCSPEGALHLTVTQRIPVLRVMADENYFVDTDRRVMPVRSTTASYVPVVTGRVPQHFAKEELFDFVCWLEDQDYWRAQIEQINVVNPQMIELVPRVGSGVIVLGPLTDYEAKLKKLRKLYKDGFSKFGWGDYKEIDLRFNGQVVCR